MNEKNQVYRGDMAGPVSLLWDVLIGIRFLRIGF